MEQWKDIEGWTGYQISSEGRVKSLNRHIEQLDRTGDTIKVWHKGQIIKSHPNWAGYILTNLTRKGKTTKIAVHRLVAKSFILNPYNKKTVNHKDGNKANNRVTNLEWATLSENIQHAYDTGLKKGRGKNLPK